MALIVSLLIVLAALGACLLPLLEEPVSTDEPVGGERLGELDAERDRLIDAMRDLDLDLAMGKIAASDHQEMKRGLETRTVEVLGSIERAHAETDD